MNRDLLLVMSLMLASARVWAGSIGEPLQGVLTANEPGEPVAVIIYFTAPADLTALQTMSAGQRRAALPVLLKKHAANSQSPIKTYLHAQGITQYKTLWINNALATIVPAELVALLAARSEVDRIDLDRTFNLPAPVGGRR